jgi:hypothetical protein
MERRGRVAPSTGPPVHLFADLGQHPRCAGLLSPANQRTIPERVPPDPRARSPLYFFADIRRNRSACSNSVPRPAPASADRDLDNHLILKKDHMRLTNRVRFMIQQH